MNIVTLSMAKEIGAKRYFTGRACVKGHIADRWTINGTCVVCHAIKVAKYQADRPEMFAAIKKRHAEKPENRETNRVASARVRARNPGKATAWKRANPERARELNRQSAKRNPAAQTAKLVARRVALLNAYPIWADRAAIAAVYVECARLTREMGIKHHVDHIVPLRGKNVCGLHVHYNLQVIKASENIAKSNKLWELAA